MGEPHNQFLATSGERQRSRELFYKKLDHVNARITSISDDSNDESLTLHLISQQIYTRASKYSGATSTTQNGYVNISPLPFFSASADYTF